MTPRSVVLAALFSVLVVGEDALAQQPTAKEKSDPRVTPAKGAVAVRMSFLTTRVDERERAEACVAVEGASGNIKVDSLTLAVDGVRVNSRPPETATRRSRTGEECNPTNGAVFDVDLLPGPNRFQATAYAANDATVADTTLFAPIPVPGARLYILTVGVDAYPGALQLSYARRDAQAFADSLRRQAGRLFDDSVFVHPLLDAAATKGAIDAKFVELSAVVRPNDTFVFFYAGHGTIVTIGPDTAFYLAPAGVTDLNNPKVVAPHGIQAAELQLWLRRIAASRKLLVLDACNSGEMTAYSRTGRGEVLLGDFSKATRAGIYAATQPSTPGAESGARESGRLGHGLFTAALVSYTRKPDERPSIRSVRDWGIAAEEMFANLAENVAQRPTIEDLGQRFPILVR